MYFSTVWTVWVLKKMRPKKFLSHFFYYMFHVKTRWNIIYKYLKTKIFLEDKNIPLKRIES